MILTNSLEKKDMALTLTRTFEIHFHWYRYEFMPWYYVMILWVFYSFDFGPCGVLLKTMWYKTIQNLNSPRCLVLEISSFEFDDYHGFRTGAGAHELFVSGVNVQVYEIRRVCNRWHEIEWRDRGIPKEILASRNSATGIMANSRWRETGIPPRFCTLPFAKNASLFVKSDYRNPFQLIYKWCSPNLTIVCCL